MLNYKAASVLTLNKGANPKAEMERKLPISIKVFFKIVKAKRIFLSIYYTDLICYQAKTYQPLLSLKQLYTFQMKKLYVGRQLIVKRYWE